MGDACEARLGSFALRMDGEVWLEVRRGGAVGWFPRCVLEVLAVRYCSRYHVSRTLVM